MFDLEGQVQQLKTLSTSLPLFCQTCFSIKCSVITYKMHFVGNRMLSISISWTIIKVRSVAMIEAAVSPFMLRLYKQAQWIIASKNERGKVYTSDSQYISHVNFKKIHTVCCGMIGKSFGKSNYVLLLSLCSQNAKIMKLLTEEIWCVITNDKRKTRLTSA